MNLTDNTLSRMYDEIYKDIQDNMNKLKDFKSDDDREERKMYKELSILNQMLVLILKLKKIKKE
jgi:hypothetical protein